MGKYYDIDKPFSITNWNDLVSDVNDILQNPPGSGVGCEPVDPIDEVEDPHIWAVEDVEEVREKLQETCAGLTFTEELEIWRPEIIDEIEDQMENAWCDCEDAEPVITSCGGFDQVLTSAGQDEDKCCDNVETSAPCGCGGDCHRVTYRGDWYPSVYTSNQALLDEMSDSYSEAISARGNFIGAINAMFLYASNIVKWQGYVDSYTSAVDAGIAFYSANCNKTPPDVDDPTCPDVVYSIQISGDAARYWQDKVDAEVVKFTDKYTYAMGKLSEADSAASDNWSAALGLEGRYPSDVNHISECFDSLISDMDWYKWWNPYRDSNIQDVIPSILVWMENVVKYGAGYGASFVTIYLAPGGDAFAPSNLGARYVNRYSLTYYEEKFETRTFPGCEWGIDHDFEKIWYRDDDWALYAPLPEPDPADYGTYEPHIRITKPGVAGQDNTTQQDEWFETYNNWYDEHEAYDDRHESY